MLAAMRRAWSQVSSFGGGAAVGLVSLKR